MSEEESSEEEDALAREHQGDEDDTNAIQQVKTLCTLCPIFILYSGDPSLFCVELCARFLMFLPKSSILLLKVGEFVSMILNTVSSSDESVAGPSSSSSTSAASSSGSTSSDASTSRVANAADLAVR